MQVKIYYCMGKMNHKSHKELKLEQRILINPFRPDDVYRHNKNYIIPFAIQNKSE